VAADVSPQRDEVWLVAFGPSIGGEIQKTRPAVVVSNDAESDAIEIIFGATDKFDFLHVYPNAMARRTILLRMKNVGDGWLSDCKAFVTGTSPKISDRAILLRPGMTLMKGQYELSQLQRIWKK
jgi:hypothetical protein